MHKEREISRMGISGLKGLGLEAQLALIQHHLSLTQFLVNELLQSEVEALAGPVYSREKPNDGRYSRWGYNPSTVSVGTEKVRVEVPRVIDNRTGRHHTLSVWAAMKANSTDEESLYQAILRGLSLRDYALVVDGAAEALGLSKSRLSRLFVEKTAEKLREFTERDLSGLNIVALFLDAKHQAGQQIIIALGVTERGEKVPLGFAQADGESARAVNGLFEGLKRRGLAHEKGLLVVIDGSKGFRRSVTDQFGSKALVQRCSWHKRENVLSHLPKNMHEQVKKSFNEALADPDLGRAQEKMRALQANLRKTNLSAANSLDEGFEELFTLHRLGAVTLFAKSFQTTNCIENLNGLLEKYTAKIKHWTDSEQRHRWVAASLLEIEKSLHKVKGFEHLHLLQNAITNFVNKTD